jgi:hypothetical protein
MGGGTSLRVRRCDEGIRQEPVIARIVPRRHGTSAAPYGDELAVN